MRNSVDKWFLWITLALTVLGFFIFFSASLGLLAHKGAEFSGIVTSQAVSIILGLIALFGISRVHYRYIKKYALSFFLASLAITALVFVPSLGAESGGALRWLSIGSVSFQPAELLKVGAVLYFSVWMSAAWKQMHSFLYGALPFLVIAGVVGLILLLQPDTGTLVIIWGTMLAMFVLGGARWKHISGVFILSLVIIFILIFSRPYVMDRISVFLNPALDPQGAGYQIQQSFIAIGSGELFGRGFGQSIQKFSFLPTPVSDSIFSVFSEEFGFIGAAALVTLFTALALRGLALARAAPDRFSRLTIFGIVILITGQAFLNMGSMLGVFPLTGLPLPLVSHGGSAMITTLAAAGIVLSISRYCRV